MFSTLAFFTRSTLRLILKDSEIGLTERLESSGGDLFRSFLSISTEECCKLLR